MAKRKSSKSDAKRSAQSFTPPNPPPSGSQYAVPSVTDEENELKEHRVRSTSDIQSAFFQLWSADQVSDYNRAIQQAFIDGVPPYSDVDTAATGRVNVNCGFGRKLMETFELPYTDLLESSGVLFNVKTNHGDERSRQFTEPLLAQGISRMLRRWRPYTTLYQQRAQLFVREGVAITFFDDAWNWQWKVMGQQNMKFPREAPTCEDELDCCGCRVDMNVSDLMRYIKNPKIAEEQGWNVKAVEEAVKKAKPRDQYIANDYQHWQSKWKDNDVLWSVTAPVIQTIHWWQGEVDGSVSHYIVPWSGDGEIFYTCENKFTSFSRMLTLFTYGIGTNGDLQSCRGQGSFGYQMGNAMNRLWCASIEMGMHANTPHIECTSEDGVNDLPIRRMGPYMTVQSGTKFVETHVPDFGSTLVPLFGITANIFQQQTQGGSSLIPTQALERKTNMQEQNEMAREGSLTASQMTIFFTAEECHLREVLRRIIRPSYRQDEPGGREVYQLKLWLERHDVPLKALYEIDVDSLEVNTGIGRGSRLDRLNSVRQMMEDYYLYDRRAQNILLRTKSALLSNPQLGNELVPLEEGNRPGEQVQVAVDENGHLVSKNDIQISSVVILPDQDHAAHVVEAHIPFLQQLWPMTQAQDPMGAFEVIAPLWEHATAQWENMNPESPEYKQAKQDLQQMGEWVTNTAKQLAAEQQRAALEGQEAGMEQQGSEQGATAMVHAADAQAKLQDVAASRAKLDMDVAREQMKLNFQTATMQAKLRHQVEMQSVKKAERLLDLQAKLNQIQAAKAKKPAA